MCLERQKNTHNSKAIQTTLWKILILSRPQTTIHTENKKIPSIWLFVFRV